MLSFQITPTNYPNLKQALTDKINHKTKPPGSLGVLEPLALQIGLIQNTLNPKLNNPTIVVFAGDHGIASKGEVNPFPQEVTAQMVYNFVNKGAAINAFCKSNHINLQVVDAGVNHVFPDTLDIVHAKIGHGTKNYEIDPAMSRKDCIKAINAGAEIVEKHYNSGCNVIGFGEMGIGNTSSASLIMSALLDLSINECVGSGTGLDNDGIRKKATILERVAQLHNKDGENDPIDILSTYGGFEIAMICGGILKAASLKMVVIIDGFIVTAALLVAKAINKNVLDYCVYAHTSGEQGHTKMLNHLEAKPLLNLGLRLGEGTGGALCFPLITAAVSFLNEMASFTDAQVTNSEL